MPDNRARLDVPVSQEDDNTNLDGGRGRLADVGIINIRLRCRFDKFT